MTFLLALLQLAHHEVRVQDLPPPQVSRREVDNPPTVTPRPPGAELHLPPGFRVEVFADGLHRPRWLALTPNGDVLVAESFRNRILLFRGKERFTFADGLNLPFGMAFWKDWFYVANTSSVVRFHYGTGQTRIEGPAEPITTLPGRGYNQHWTRNLIFSPDGSKLFVTVGSETNDSSEPEPRASILEMNPDGSARREYATGTRNPVGLAFQPGTGTLWAAVEERDLLGDDLPPDYVTSIRDGGFYGWPYAYAGPIEDPNHRGERPDLVKRTIVPDVLIQAHSAVLGLVFYDGKMFPPEYHGNAFVALHGSWNRSRRTGYKIIRIRFGRDGRPLGGYDDFLTGWMVSETSPFVWARPVGLLVMPDGSLLIADDGGGKIWRVTYQR